MKEIYHFDMGNQVHFLKTINPHYHHIETNVKTFEVRKDDRGFMEGDVLFLAKYHKKDKTFYNQYLLIRVTHILRDKAFCKKGKVIMSIKKINEFDLSIDEQLKASDHQKRLKILSR